VAKSPLTLSILGEDLTSAIRENPYVWLSAYIAKGKKMKLSSATLSNVVSSPPVNCRYTAPLKQSKALKTNEIE
jgi:hypothetical protein